MTFEEWYQANQHNIPFDDKELGAAWELLKYFWEEGYNQGAATKCGNEGLPGMEEYTYEQFSKDCDRW